MQISASRLGLVVLLAAAGGALLNAWYFKADPQQPKILGASSRPQLRADNNADARAQLDANRLTLSAHAAAAAQSNQPSGEEILGYQNKIDTRKRIEFRSGVLANQTIQHIGEEVTLSEEESATLSKALSAFYLDISSRDPFPENSLAMEEELIVQVLGDAKGNAYLQAKAQASERMRSEQIALASAAFTQRLGLSAQQSQKLSEILPAVVTETQPNLKALSNKVREVMYKNFPKPDESIDNTVGQSEIEAIIGQLREERRALINQALKPVLNGDQYSRLINAQAQAGAQGLWGLKGY